MSVGEVTGAPATPRLGGYPSQDRDIDLLIARREPVGSG